MSRHSMLTNESGARIGSYLLKEEDDLIIVHHPGGGSKSAVIGGSDIELLARDLLREIEVDANSNTLSGDSL